MEKITEKLQYVKDAQEHAIKILEVSTIALELAQYAGALEAKAKELSEKTKELEDNVANSEHENVVVEEV